jgi:hypothetical protein
VGTVYLISGLLVYLLVVALITQVLKQNNVPAAPDRRVGDRRQNAEARRKGPRSSSGETRRVSDRRSMYAGALA